MSVPFEEEGDDDMVPGDGDGEPEPEPVTIEEEADPVEELAVDSDDDTKSVATEAELPVKEDVLDDSEDEVGSDDEERAKSKLSFQLVERTKIQLRKEVLRVADDDRITSDIMTQAEMTEAISIRASQVAQSAVMTVSIDSGVDDPIVIAKMELAARRCPLVLRRIIGRVVDRRDGSVNDIVEDWDVNTMIYPSSIRLPPIGP